MLAFVDIEHFSAVFGFAYIEHLTGTYGTSAVRIEFVTYSLHLDHVLQSDGFVATFIKQDTGIITVVNDSIAHQFCPLFPLTTSAIFFRITGGHRLNESDTVARFHVLLPGSDVHPAD